MSNPNYTHIVLLIDASGSMEPTKQATIDGINSFIESQKTLPNNTERNLSFDEDLGDSSVDVKCTVSLAMFSGEKRKTYAAYNSLSQSSLSPNPTNNGEPEEDFNYTKLYEGIDISDVTPLATSNYDTYGGTPLIDAFHKCITECSGFINRLKEDERPGRIMIVSVTDGEENQSKEKTKQELKQLITEKTALNWQFIYLGANQDAFSESQSYGVSKGQSYNYVQDNAGITSGFRALSCNVLQKRSVDAYHMTNCCITDLEDGGKDSTVSGGTSTEGSINYMVARRNKSNSLINSFNTVSLTSNMVKYDDIVDSKEDVD